MPTSRPESSTTGRALMWHCSSSRTSSWKGVAGRAVTTSLVMTASTVCSMMTPLWSRDRWSHAVRKGRYCEPRSWLLALQSLQPVIGRVLVRLAEGGQVESPVDEGVDRLPGDLPDDVDPEQTTVVPPEDQLDQPLRRPCDLGPGTVLEPSPPHLAVDARRSGRLLGHPHHRSLGDGVDPVGRQGVQGLLEGDPKGVGGRHAALLHRDRRQRRRPDHVAGRIDPLRRGPVGLVHDDPSPRVGLHPGLGEPEAFGAARPAANSTFSGCKRSPLASVTRSWPPTRATVPTPDPSASRIPMPTNALASTSEISVSMNGSSRSARSSRVTSTPSAVNTEAYSHPTGPPPTTTIDRGMRSRPMMFSGSCTSGSSKGISGGRSGLEPVAIRITPACRVRSEPSSDRTITEGPGPSLAWPRSSWTRFRSRLAWTDAVLVAITSAVRASSRSRASEGSSCRLSP